MVYLFGIIVLLIAYIFYESVSSRKERERLQLKLMSKDLADYKSVTEPEPESVQPKEELEQFVEPEEVRPEDLIKAEDHL